MEKDVHINSHIFSRNLAAKLGTHKYIVFNLLSIKGQPIFKITDTNSDVIKDFCKSHGTKFNLNQQRVINVNDQFNLVFD